MNPESGCRIILDRILQKEADNPEQTNRVVVYGNLAGFAPSLTRHIRETGKKFDLERDVDLCPNSNYWREAFFGLKPNLGIDQSPTIPGLVIVCNGIRQYDPWNGNGMTIDSFSDQDSSGKTFFDYISGLCDEWGVPVMKNDQEDDNLFVREDIDDDAGSLQEFSEDERDDDS